MRDGRHTLILRFCRLLISRQSSTGDVSHGINLGCHDAFTYGLSMRTVLPQKRNSQELKENTIQFKSCSPTKSGFIWHQSPHFMTDEPRFPSRQTQALFLDYTRVRIFVTSSGACCVTSCITSINCTWRASSIWPIANTLEQIPCSNDTTGRNQIPLQ